MTAYAMKGERERCLAAGMDDYLSKPVQATELLGVIARVVPANAPSAGPSPEPPAAAAEPAFDPRAALDQLGGEESFLAEIIGLFLEDLPTRLEEVRRTLQEGDALGLRRAAHTLKGAAANLCAGGACAAAQELESAAASGDLAAGPGALRRLEQELAILVPALRGFTPGSPCERSAV
jgi:HPt (histidine-containing phosphotransfer) domain-containing protein